MDRQFQPGCASRQNVAAPGQPTLSGVHRQDALMHQTRDGGMDCARFTAGKVSDSAGREVKGSEGRFAAGQT